MYTRNEYTFYSEKGVLSKHLESRDQLSFFTFITYNNDVINKVFLKLKYESKKGDNVW